MNEYGVGLKARRGLMAGFARQCRRNVGRRFSHGNRAVVAHGTGSDCLRVIDHANVGPHRRLMATFAASRALRVIDRLALSAAKSGTVVAIVALSGRALENPADVTRLAFGRAMAAGKWISGLEVIE